MKITGIIMSILLVALAVFALGSFVGDLETYYLDTNISSSQGILNDTIMDSLDRSEEINQSFAPILNTIDAVNTGEKSAWMQFVVAAEAIPSFIGSLITSIIALPFIINGMIVTALDFLGIPREFIYILYTMVTVFIIFRVVSLWRRHDA